MSSTTEAPFSALENGTKPSRGTLENGAAGVDIPVRIHGSQVTAVVLDATEHVEPFEEDTSTMIVLPQGAVVRLRAQVRTGHTVILTNLQNHQTVPCRIVQVNAANSSHYVKLEFTEPSEGFWDVHSAPNNQNLAAPAEHLAVRPIEVQKPMPASTVAQIPWQDDTPALRSPANEALPTKPLPATHDALRFTDSSEKESTPKYEPLRDTHNEIVPLAAGPVKAVSDAPKAKSLTTSSESKAAPSPAADSRTSATAIFDSLSTDEDIFGAEKPTPSPAGTSAFNLRKQHEVTLRSLNEPVLSQARGRSSRGRMFVALAALITLAAGGGWYFRQHLKTAIQSVSRKSVESNAPAGEAPAEAPTQIAQTAAQTPAQVNVPTSPTQPAQQSPAPNAAAPSNKTQGEESAITITPVGPQPDASAASIYAGDLNARPKSGNHGARMAAAIPKITTSVPGTAAPDLNPLMSSSTPGLPVPVAPVSGGKLVQPRLIHSVPPSYPAIANANRVEGDVQIQTLIDETGKVTAAKAISGPDLLRNAAVAAVRQWKYSPATLDGKAISMKYILTVRFRRGQE